MNYVIFLDHASPKANSTNIHRITCGHYEKYLRKGSKGTKWEEVPDIPSARSMARHLHKQYQTKGIKFAVCCMKDYATQNPVN